MLGVTFNNMKRIREMGYHIIEEETKIHIINPKGETVVEICLDKNALLSISIGGETLEQLEWVEIEGIVCPKRILIEIRKKDGNSSMWSELPLRKGETIFW